MLGPFGAIAGETRNIKTRQLVTQELRATQRSGSDIADGSRVQIVVNDPCELASRVKQIEQLGDKHVTVRRSSARRSMLAAFTETASRG